MPKVIVVNDSDGHVDVFEWTVGNARALVEGYLRANEYNTMTDDEGDLRDLLARFDGTDEWLAEAEGVIDSAVGGRSHGNLVNVLEAEGVLTADQLYGLLV